MARTGKRWQVEASGIDMGEMTMISNGIATTIHDDGSKTVMPVDQCDNCQEWVTRFGGLTIRDAGNDVVIWLCSRCRK